ncbi:hypothetical protein EMIT093MI4_10301 [Pseudomonas sp. IT-93MI4]
MAQAPDVVTDVLQDGRPLAGIFVHYIAHSVGLGSILRNVGRIVRPAFYSAQGHDVSEQLPHASSLLPFQQGRVRAGADHHGLGRYVSAGATRHDRQWADVLCRPALCRCGRHCCAVLLAPVA